MKKLLMTSLAALSMTAALLFMASVSVKAEMTYDLNGNQIDTAVWTKSTSMIDGSYKITSSEAGTIAYFDKDGKLLKLENKATGEIIIDNTPKETTTAAQKETTTAKTVEKITLPKVKKLKKKTKYAYYKGVKSIDKNGKAKRGKIKYKYGIKLTWQKVKGATGYEIYRYENAAKRWTKIKTIKKNKSKIPSYTLTNMLKGENVKIKIRAYKNTKSGKEYGTYSSILKFKTKQMYTKIYKNAKTKSFYSKWASEDAFVIQNQYRKAAGISVLKWSDTLYKISKQRAYEASIEFTHWKRPQGGSFLDTFEDILGREAYVRAGGMTNFSENLHSGGTTASAAVGSWYKTQFYEQGRTHYDNMIDKKWQQGAIAVYYRANVDYVWQSSYSESIVD